MPGRILLFNHRYPAIDCRESYRDGAHAGRCTHFKEYRDRRFGTVVSDRHRLSVIINNLVSNGFKYFDPEKKDSFFSIYVQITEEKVVMVFSDNGIGIDQEYLDKVFDMFFRATQSVMGSGLGLYIVQEAVHKLRGEVSVESQIGGGTTFRIEMPNFAKG